MSFPSPRSWLSSLLGISLLGCGGMSEGHHPPADSGTGVAGECAVPQVWFLDLDGDQFGDESINVSACQAPAGYVAQGGDCNDYDPLRHPGASGDPGFIYDKCGKGQPVEAMNATADWIPLLSSETGGSGSMAEETGGCLGGNSLAFKYDLPEPSACGTAACAWVVMRKTLATAVDLSGHDYLLFPFRGDPNDPSLQVDLRLEDRDGCRVTWPLESASNLPAKRAAVVPLKWFSTPGPGRDCKLDLSQVKAIEVGVSGQVPATGAWAKDTGVLHLDALTGVKASDLRMSPTFFACPSTKDYGVRGRIVADLLNRHRDSLGKHGHPFVPSWFEETPSRYHIYDQALLLMVFSLEAGVWGSSEARAAATTMATALLDLQSQSKDGVGGWYDTYLDQTEGSGLVAPTEPSSSVGSAAWVVMALDLYRDLLLPSPRKTVDDAIALAANGLESRMDAYKAAGRDVGAISAGTQGNISTFFALVAAERFARAAEMKKVLLDTLWKADEQRFWAGAQDPGLAIDVIGNWGVEFLRAVGEHDKALAGLGLAAGLFPTRSFDDKHQGLGDVAGPWQPTIAFAGQYLAAGGWGSLALLPELLAYENNGTFPGAPDDFAGGAGGNSKGRGIAPAAWAYLALSPDIMARLSLPIFTDDLEGDTPWLVSDEAVGPRPECYGTALGSAARSTEVAAGGSTSLCVSANPGKVSILSDHVVAQRRIVDAGQPGTLRLEADVVIPPEPDLNGQVGPELRVQNTRRASSDSFTVSTFAVQYLANPAEANYGNWALWSDSEPGIAGWKVPAGLTYKLTPGVWYHIRLIGNFDSHRYSDLIISTQDPSAAVPLKAFDLSAHPILAEPSKATEEALSVGVAAENQSNSCGATAATEYRVCYDNVMVRR